MADREIIAAILAAGRITAEGLESSAEQAVIKWEETLAELAKNKNAQTTGELAREQRLADALDVEASEE